jgi:hypothetical protein
MGKQTRRLSKHQVEQAHFQLGGATKKLTMDLNVLSNEKEIIIQKMLQTFKKVPTKFHLTTISLSRLWKTPSKQILERILIIHPQAIHLKELGSMVDKQDIKIIRHLKSRYY